MRALVITNMYPTAQRPWLGSFVRDQVEALQRLPGLDVSVHVVPPGGPAGYLEETWRLRRRRVDAPPDIVHAHFGLSAWPALAVPGVPRLVTLHGTDLAHRRSRAITLAALPFLDVVATPSADLARRLPRWLPASRRALLPCGVDLARFCRQPREKARRELGLSPDAPHVLFPSDPARPEKRFDRAREVAGETRILTLSGIAPEQVPLYVNAANAVVIPSEREGYGLALLEALACDVPVLTTPVGVACDLFAGSVPRGCLCAPFDAESWRAALAPHLAVPDPRVETRSLVRPLSSEVAAERVARTWRRLVDDQPAGEDAAGV